MKTRIFALLLTLSLLFAVAPMAGAADSIIVYSGTCGNNVEWTLDENGLLNIFGIGPMEDLWNIGGVPWYAYRSSIKTVTIGNGVTTIGRNAFFSCDSLTSITIPDSVTTIDSNVFGLCTGLTSVTIGNSVTTIGNSAFLGCTSLTSVTIPNSVTTIGDSAFYDCTSLASVTIPDSVTTISGRAFHSCTSLTSVAIPGSVTTIGYEAFTNCNNLTEFAVSASNPNYSSLDGVLFSKDKTTLVTYPGGKSGAYTIPDSVTTVGGWAFEDCSSLTSVAIPDSVTTIGYYAFTNCSNLTSITMGDSVMTIDYEAFTNCNNLTEFAVSAANPNYSSLDGVLFSKDKTTLVTYPGGKSGAYTIPNSVTTIGVNAFYNCDSLTSVTIPNSVTAIGDSAFYDCTSLTSVTMGDSVTTIGGSAFSGCDSLTYNTYDNAKYLGNDGNLYLYLAETTSASITTCTIHSDTRIIGADAFYYCKSLTSITIPDSVTSIGADAFDNCDSLTSITIPDSVTTIGDFAFDNCDSLTSVTIPNSVTTIGWGTFAYCRSLTSVTIPNSVTTIGEYAFYYCKSLTSITIPDGVTTIGGWAFEDCSSLTSVTIPNSVTTIGEYAFERCNSLTDVYYNGTKTQWSKISIEGGNGSLRSANLHTIEPEFTDYSLNLDSAIRLNFYVSEAPGFTSFIDMNGVRYDKQGDFYPTRLFNAKEMTDEVTVKLVNEYDGETNEGDPMNVSIRNYARTLLSMVDWNTLDGDFGAKSGRLMVAMLNYGAEAQKYFGYNTENLANANIDAYQTHVTPTAESTDNRSGNDNPLYYGTACVLGANMNLKFYLNLKGLNVDDYTYQVSYTDYKDRKQTKTVELTDAQNGFYAYTLTDLVAADIDTLVTFKILDGGTEKLAVTDSISSYIARVKVSNPDCADVANAMLTFGAMAYDYFYTPPVAPPALGDDELPIG